MTERRVPLNDLRAQFAEIEREVRREIDEVLGSQNFILGAKVEAFEAALARYCQTRFAVGVSSGTDALLIALMAMGVGPGDEVITTPFTFFATAGAIRRVGARPVFVDIDFETMNLRPDLVSRAITKKTRSILPVHLFGRPVDVSALRALSDSVGIPVIEDAAQAIGAERQGRRVGSLGAVGCFSFFPTKNLGAYGDAGALTTDDDELADRLRLLRSHGASPKYFHRIIGGNFRLDALQAAVLLAKLPNLERWTKRREENAALYRRIFQNAGIAGAEGLIVLPGLAPEGDRHAYNQYVIRTSDRDRLAAYLKNQGIQTEVYYPQPLHLQDCFRDLGLTLGRFPVAEACAREALALPVAPEISADAVRCVADNVVDFYRLTYGHAAIDRDLE